VFALDMNIQRLPGRRRLARLVTLVALGAVLLLTGLARDARAELSFGMQFSTDERTNDPEDWAALGRSGTQMFRVPFSPRHVWNESTKQWEWGYYDRQFELSALNGVTLLPNVVDRIDKSASGVPDSAESGQYTFFLEEAVKRYGRNGSFWNNHPSIPAHPITDWEIWNEPNNASFGFVNAGEFGKFVGWAAAAMQKAAVAKSGMGTGVVMGGILNTSGYVEYIKTAYQNAGSANLTGVAIHPYSISQTTEDARIAQFAAVIENVRTGINKISGGSAEALWVTEYGWQVERDANPVSEMEQAKLVERSIQWIRDHAAGQGIRAGFWYNYRDSTDGSNWAYRTGLRDEMGNFRPSWFAFQRMMGAERWPLATVALQANTGTLWISKRAGGGGNTGLAMKAGTSPSIGLYGRGYKVAFQGANGDLWYYVSGVGAVDTGLGMAPGTSPSITALGGGMIAFQASNGHLWYFQTGGAVKDTGYSMEAKTSPSVSWNAQTKRYIMAFHSTNQGQLYVYEIRGTFAENFVASTGLGMAPETSPAITGDDGDAIDPDYTIGFQANTGNLWFYKDGAGGSATPFGMAPKTSPAIASVSQNRFRPFVMSFQANTGQMWLYEPGGTQASTGYGMGTGTSPAAIGLGEYLPYGNPYQVAFNAPSSMYTYEPGGWVTNSLLGPAPATSPSIAPS
jgi:hypothetical protein